MRNRYKAMAKAMAIALLAMGCISVILMIVDICMDKSAHHHHAIFIGCYAAAGIIFSNLKDN
jgi:hypothetical protein